jgi:hypothetical protein
MKVGSVPWMSPGKLTWSHIQMIMWNIMPYCMLTASLWVSAAAAARLDPEASLASPAQRRKEAARNWAGLIVNEGPGFHPC